jgi:hypothetical protein
MILRSRVRIQPPLETGENGKNRDNLGTKNEELDHPVNDNVQNIFCEQNISKN